MPLIGQQSLGYFLQGRQLLPIGWKILEMVRQCQGKLTRRSHSLLVRHLFHANQYFSLINYTQLGLVGGSSGINKKTSRGAYSSLDLPPYISTKDKSVSRGNPFNPKDTYDISCYKINLSKVMKHASQIVTCVDKASLVTFE